MFHQCSTFPYQSWENSGRRAERVAGWVTMKPFDTLVEQMTAYYGPEIGPFLARRLAAAIRKTKDLCIDNLRWAELGNAEQVATYELAKKKGCCGFHDVQITHFKTGRHFMFGFNYGH